LPWYLPWPLFFLVEEHPHPEGLNIFLKLDKNGIY